MLADAVSTVKPPALQLHRKQRRRSRSRPMQGWSLVVRASVRLGIWEKIAEQLVCRAFAFAVRSAGQGLENYMRADQFKEGGVLSVRVLNSAAVNQFHYISDIILQETNIEISKIEKSIHRYKETQRLPGPFFVTRFVFSVGPFRHLPDAEDWRPKARKRPVPMKIIRPADPMVVTEIGHIANTDLRHALYRLYSSAIAEYK